MIDFDYFVKKGEVKKSSVDKELAVYLIKDMDERIEKSLLLGTNKFSKMIFENIYDALRDFCDAVLALRGFKSYSHQGSISYLLKEGFDISFIEELDQFRYRRNGSKYYGLPISKDNAEQIKDFYTKNKTKIDKKIREMMK